MEESQPIKLSILTSRVKAALNRSFADLQIWVIAEVTNYSFYPQKNHHYFDLVEKSTNGTDILAKMQAAAWATGNLRIRNFERVTGQKFKNDIEVLVKVSVDFHATFGLKLTLLDVDPNFTIGAIERQKQDTLQQLLDEFPDAISKAGDRYITFNNSLVLRPVIQNIAVISSSQSAGLQDFNHTMEANAFGYQFNMVNYHTVVQGEAKADMIFNKLVEIFTSGLDFDAVVIIRGGGSQTDFLIFDQYILGKIVAKFPIPVITGIGHQKNETIVDLMAHTATKTPTKAAEFIIAHNRAFEERVVFFQQTIVIKSQQVFAKHAAQLSFLNSVVINRTRDLLAMHRERLGTKRMQILSRPQMMVSNKLNDLTNYINNLKSGTAQQFKQQRTQLAHHYAIMQTMSPANILRKGFAIVKLNGKIISNPENVQVGSEMAVILAGTEINSLVVSKNDYYEKDIDL